MICTAPLCRLYRRRWEICTAGCCCGELPGTTPSSTRWQRHACACWTVSSLRGRPRHPSPRLTSTCRAALATCAPPPDFLPHSSSSCPAPCLSEFRAPSWRAALEELPGQLLVDEYAHPLAPLGCSPGELPDECRGAQRRARALAGAHSRRAAPEPSGQRRRWAEQQRRAGRAAAAALRTPAGVLAARGAPSASAQGEPPPASAGAQMHCLHQIPAPHCLHPCSLCW